MKLCVVLVVGGWTEVVAAKLCLLLVAGQGWSYRASQALRISGAQVSDMYSWWWDPKPLLYQPARPDRQVDVGCREHVKVLRCQCDC